MARDPIDLNDPSYTPVRLLNDAAFLLRAKNDSMLALILECDHALLTRVRKRQQPVSDYLMVQIMDRTGWHIEYVRGLMGVPFDGPRALVLLAQRIGKRFPTMYTVSPQQ